MATSLQVCMYLSTLSVNRAHTHGQEASNQADGHAGRCIQVKLSDAKVKGTSRKLPHSLHRAFQASRGPCIIPTLPVMQCFRANKIQELAKDRKEPWRGSRLPLKAHVHIKQEHFCLCRLKRKAQQRLKCQSEDSMRFVVMDPAITQTSKLQKRTKCGEPQTEKSWNALPQHCCLFFWWRVTWMKLHRSLCLSFSLSLSLSGSLVLKFQEKKGATKPRQRLLMEARKCSYLLSTSNSSQELQMPVEPDSCFVSHPVSVCVQSHSAIWQANWAFFVK